MKVYCVTNYGGGKNYTPSVFKDENEARKWMKELGANDIFDAHEDDFLNIWEENKDKYGEEFERDIFKDEEILNYATNCCADVDIFDDEICIGDPDEYGNIIQFFEIEV